MNLDTVSALMAARMLITDPKDWIQGTHARNKRGQRVPSEAKSAVCFCAEGALLASIALVDNPLHADIYRRARRLLASIALVYNPLHADIYRRARRLLHDAAYAQRGVDIITVNDHYGHADVLSAYDRAIELAESEA